MLAFPARTVWKLANPGDRGERRFLVMGEQAGTTWEKGFGIWFTGVPASGKSTLASGVVKRLVEMGRRVENLDADEVRKNISPDLKWSKADRDMNTKRLAYLMQLITRNGGNAIVAAVSPLREFRDRARGWVDKFVEVYVKCSLEECKKRDPKGLYARGDKGEVNDIAGWHQPFEEPLKAELVLDTTTQSVDQGVDLVIQTLIDLGHLPKESAYSEEDAEKVQQRLADLGYM